MRGEKQIYAPIMVEITHQTTNTLSEPVSASRVVEQDVEGVEISVDDELATRVPRLSSPFQTD